MRESDAASSMGAATIGGAEDGWWQRERQRFVVERLRQLGVRPRLAIDLGCGRGAMGPALAEGTGAYVVGCDSEAHPGWRPVPGKVAYVVADLTAAPFRPALAELVTAFDVIEHFSDDRVPLSTMAELAHQGRGRICVTVPANPALWSPFDEDVGHYRRYRTDDLVDACAAVDVRPEDVTAFFSWLVIPSWLLRHRNRRDADGPPGSLVGRVVGGGVAIISWIERRILRRRRMRVGTSLWLVGPVGAGGSGARR